MSDRFECELCRRVTTVQPTSMLVYCGCSRVYRRTPGGFELSREADSTDNSSPTQPPGPGTELRRLLGCGHYPFATQMNEWGPDVCLGRIDEISGWLTEGDKMSDQAARRMIVLAVERARATAVGCVRNA